MENRFRMMLNHDLLDLYAAALRALPFVEEAGIELASALESDSWAPDVRVLLQTPLGEVQLLGAVKTSHLTRGVAQGLLSRLGATAGEWIVLATHVGRPMGELLREAGLNYLDQSGNCHLRIGDHYVATVEGRRAPRAEGSRGLKAAGARILFALLAEESLIKAPYRVIGARAGASHKAARDAIARLARTREVMVDGRERAWLPGGRRSAFERWLGDYDTILRPWLDYGRYRTSDRDPEEVDRTLAEYVARGSCLFGGVSAGYRLVEYYRGSGAVVHISGGVRAFSREVRALPDPAGMLTVLRLPCEAAAHGAVPGTVHPLLVYAEMLHSRDERALAAASMVRAQYLQEFK